jgi:hypothetical protein
MVNFADWIKHNGGGLAVWQEFLNRLQVELGAYDATITVLMIGYPDEQIVPQVTYEAMADTAGVVDADADTVGIGLVHAEAVGPSAESGGGRRAIFRDDGMEVIVDDKADFEAIAKKALPIELARICKNRVSEEQASDQSN